MFLIQKLLNSKGNRAYDIDKFIMYFYYSFTGEKEDG